MWHTETHLVYRFNVSTSCEQSVSSEFHFQWLNHDIVNTFFSAEAKRKQKFEQFLNSGFTGLMFHVDGMWSNYMWMSRPESDGPFHLPATIRKQEVNWITHCRTNVHFQKCGLYKAGLFKLIQCAQEDDPNKEIYIDTRPTNIASQRAILKMGFKPNGVIKRRKIGISRIRYRFLGVWDKEALHY